MKKTLIFLFLLPTLVLSGCGSLQQQLRELENMKIIQAMGIDREREGLRLSLAAAPDKAGEKGEVLSGSGNTVSGALQRIRSHAGEEDLFCAHVGHILMGEEAAQAGMDDILAYVCHSAEIRMDVPLYLLLGSPAGEAMKEAGGKKLGAAEILQSVQSSLEHQGYSHVFTAVEILRNLESNGSALVCALEYTPASEGEQEKTFAVYGYGILRDGVLEQTLDRDSAIGAGLLINKSGICEITVKDLRGNLVALELDEGKCRLEPLWSEQGHLSGLDVQIQVSAAILETGGRSGQLNEAQYEDQLTAQLEAAVSQRVQNVLLLSKRMGADFLGLGERLMTKAPADRRSALTDFASLLPGLPIHVSVSGKLSHSYDTEVSP